MRIFLLTSLLLLTACEMDFKKPVESVDREVVEKKSLTEVVKLTKPKGKKNTVKAVQLHDGLKIYPEQARYYQIKWMGLHVGDFVAGISQSGDKCKVQVYGAAKGLTYTLTKYKLNAESEFKCGDKIQPSKFSYNRRLKKKKRAIGINFSENGKSIISETNTRPDHPGKRPPVADELKKGVFDPISLALRLREEVDASKKSGSLKLYEGRKLSIIDYKKLSSNQGTKIQISQKFIAGQTGREKKKSEKGPEVITIYLDENLWPTKAVGESPLGTATMHMKAVCEDFDGCLKKKG